jgi:hypothetical protein
LLKAPNFKDNLEDFGKSKSKKVNFWDVPYTLATLPLFTLIKSERSSKLLLFSSRQERERNGF